MEDILLKLGFIKSNNLFELHDVKDNLVICKMWEIVEEKGVVTDYIKKSLLKDPFCNYISVLINGERFEVNLREGSNITTRVMDISYFIPIFSGILSDKRNVKLNTILN